MQNQSSLFLSHHHFPSPPTLIPAALMLDASVRRWITGQEGCVWHLRCPKNFHIIPGRERERKLFWYEGWKKLLNFGSFFSSDGTERANVSILNGATGPDHCVMEGRDDIRCKTNVCLLQAKRNPSSLSFVRFQPQHSSSSFCFAITCVTRSVHILSDQRIVNSVTGRMYVRSHGFWRLQWFNREICLYISNREKNKNSFRHPSIFPANSSFLVCWTHLFLWTHVPISVWMQEIVWEKPSKMRERIYFRKA